MSKGFVEKASEGDEEIDEGTDHSEFDGEVEGLTAGREGSSHHTGCKVHAKERGLARNDR